MKNRVTMSALPPLCIFLDNLRKYVLSIKCTVLMPPPGVLLKWADALPMDGF